MNSQLTKKHFPELIESENFDVITYDEEPPYKSPYCITLSAGVDHVDSSRYTNVYSLTNENTQSVVEYLLFYIMNRIRFGKVRDPENLREYKGFTLSHFSYKIIGFGKIGKGIYQALKALNCADVEVCNSTRNYHDSEILIVCCPLNKQTRRSLTDEYLSNRVKMIFNVSRKEVLSLNQDTKKNIVFDDFQKEFSIFGTPHIAGRTESARLEIINTVNNLISLHDFISEKQQFQK